MAEEKDSGVRSHLRLLPVLLRLEGLSYTPLSHTLKLCYFLCNLWLLDSQRKDIILNRKSQEESILSTVSIAAQALCSALGCSKSRFIQKTTTWCKWRSMEPLEIVSPWSRILHSTMPSFAFRNWANEPRKECASSLAIREAKVRTVLRFSYTNQNSGY